MLFDTHAHLNDDAYLKDLEETIERAKEAGVKLINIVGFDDKSIEKALEITAKYDFLYLTIGWHPVEAIDFTEEKYEMIKNIALTNDKVIAIGEIGLDYHWMTRPKEEQFKIFRRQLELARRVNKPVVIHTREAMEDTINILNEYPDVKGILHCYPGSVESAKRMIDRFYLGIGGVLTFKNAKKLVDVVKDIPIEHLVIETDCPYMAPTPYRGQRNEPIYTEEVAKKIAELKNMSYEDVVRITNENTRKVFKML